MAYFEGFCNTISSSKNHSFLNSVTYLRYSSLHYQIVVDQQMRILGRQDIYRT